MTLWVRGTVGFIPHWRKGNVGEVCLGPMPQEPFEHGRDFRRRDGFELGINTHCPFFHMPVHLSQGPDYAKEQDLSPGTRRQGFVILRIMFPLLEELQPDEQRIILFPRRWEGRAGVGRQLLEGGAFRFQGRLGIAVGGV